MPLRKFAILSRRSLHASRPLQIGLVLLVWLLGDALARWTAWPIPGSIFGMVILLILLSSRTISQTSLRRGANWFVAEMLLFFVPAVLAVLDHRDLLGLLGLKIMTVIVVSTALVMGATALVVEIGFRVLSSPRDDNHAVE